MLKTKTRDGEIKNLKYQTEKDDHENILKNPKIDEEYSKKKYKSLNKKRIILNIMEILIGSGSAIGSYTMSLIKPGVGLIVLSSTALLTSIAILITNECISKLKIRYTKLRDWNNVITWLYEKTLKTSLVDKKIDEKETQELKRFIILIMIKEKK